MALQDYVDSLAEDKRDAFKAEIAKAVLITSEAEAEAFASSNPLLRTANQRYRDGKLDETKKEFFKNFNEVELPKLVDQKYKEKHPDADPKDLAYKALEEKLNTMSRDGTLKERKAAALTKLAELELPVSLAELAIDLDETSFEAKLKLLTGLKTWKEEAVSKALAEKLGNQGKFKAGDTTAPDFSKMSVTEVMAYAQKGAAELAAVMEYQKRK